MQIIHAVFGSPSDEAKILPGILEFTREHAGLEVRIYYASADNTPDKVEGIARQLEDERHPVVISGAGLSNVLTGSIKSKRNPHTIHIGVPISDSSSCGLTALLSTAEKPPMNPVLCVGVDNTYAACNIASRFFNGLKGVALKQPFRRNDCLTKGLEQIAKHLRDFGIEFIDLDAGEFYHGVVIVPFDYSDLSRYDRILRGGRGVQVGVSCSPVHENPEDYLGCLNDTWATGIVSSQGYLNAVYMAALLTNNLGALLKFEEKRQRKQTDLTAHSGLIVKNGEVIR
ncbi:AIR carboxylase family protein [Candidatus Pacearchaeota archaeon]|nr:AIR carboxylase family protein [Candidatus Pacearchaeota archaeon]